MGERWTRPEEVYLTENYQTANLTDMMKHLDRSHLSIKRKAQEMELDRNIYEGGLYYSTGDVMSALGLAKSTVLYYVSVGYIKCDTLKSFNKSYKKFTVEDIVVFMCKYPQKWIKRDYDLDVIQMFLLDYCGVGAKAKRELIKSYINKPKDFWRTSIRKNIKTEEVPTIDERLEAI